MDDSVKKFRARRDARLKKRMDDDWITIKGTHVMVDEDKNITAGPERLRNAKGSGKVVAKKESPFAEIDPDDKGLAEWAKKEGYKSAWSEPFYDKQGRKVMEGHFSYADKYGRTVYPSDIKKKRGESQKGGSGSGDIGAEYERIPRVFALGGSKYATPEEKKQRKETIDRFMAEAKDGDVYSTGGGVGSGGSKFKVSSRGGKLQLQWERSGGYSKPVIMSRSNVEKYICNGAKLVSRK